MPKLDDFTISESSVITGKYKTLKDLLNTNQISFAPVTLHLRNCSIESLNEALPILPSLKSLTFNKCNENVFKAFTNQEALKKITVGNNQWTWNGFPHDIFNEICRNSKNLNHLVLDGAGTGSYFDCDDFPYKITKLETTIISFNWYVGIRTQRNAFLKSQQGNLKDLTIHQLPYDFDGGKVLKFIIEEMKLDNFYYGNIPLIVNKVKQVVKEFTASEIQITSAVEMIKQFLCHKFTLILSGTDIAYEEIEKIVNPPTDLFKDVKEFEVIDNGSGQLGVFLGLLKNLKSIRKLTIKSNDKNIKAILNELPEMPDLMEIQLTDPLSMSGVNTSKFGSNFKFTKVSDVAPQGDIGVAGGSSRNVPIHGPRAEGAVFGRGGGGGGGDDSDDSDDSDGGGDGDGDGNDDDNRNRRPSIGFPAGRTIEGNIVKRTEPNNFRSVLFVAILPEAGKCYYYITPYGYYMLILNHLNIEEFESLIGELISLIYITKNEQGKLSFKLWNESQQNRDLLHAKIKELSFIPHNMDVQLPLIIRHTNLLVQVSCLVNRDEVFYSLIRDLSLPNGMSASHWMQVDLIPDGDRFRMIFEIDGKSYSQIQAMNHQLDFRGGRIDVRVEFDPYEADIRSLPF
ncbi:uncharacterized protein [Chironomus tepperi]